MLEGDATFTGCTWAFITALGEENGLGLNVAVLGGVATFTGCTFNEFNAVVSFNAAGQAFYVGGKNHPINSPLLSLSLGCNNLVLHIIFEENRSIRSFPRRCPAHDRLCLQLLHGRYVLERDRRPFGKICLLVCSCECRPMLSFIDTCIQPGFLYIFCCSLLRLISFFLTFSSSGNGR